MVNKLQYMFVAISTKTNLFPGATVKNASNSESAGVLDMHTHTHTPHTYTHILCLYLHTPTPTHTHLYPHTHTYTYKHTHTYTHVYTPTHPHLQMYTQTHLHITPHTPHPHTSILPGALTFTGHSSAQTVDTIGHSPRGRGEAKHATHH